MVLQAQQAAAYKLWIKSPCTNNPASLPAAQSWIACSAVDLVSGSAVLIGGNPGAGKSTLLLQLLCKLANEQSCLYVTGEESLQQVAMRARRLGLPTDKLQTLVGNQY
jgi:predicted ATP-dependent serine protease